MPDRRKLPSGVWPRDRVLAPVLAHLPDGVAAYGILVAADARTLPVVHEGRSVRAYVGGEPHEEAMSLEAWASLVATGTAWILTDDHVELAPPAEPARQPVASRLPPAQTSARAMWPDLAPSAGAWT